MKKQLQKIKNAAENFSRSSKSDKSTDDLQKADKQVEHVKDVLDKVAKKFSANPVPTVAVQQTLEQDNAAREKRIKKVHEYRLALAIEESLKDLPDSLMRDVLDNCAKLERQIAVEIVQNEINVENDVTRRLTTVQETQLSTIAKQKRNVTKAQQDSDSARHKYQSAVRLNESLPKIAQLKVELEECESKLEKERDIWAAEMFELIAEEETIASNILNYVRFQQLYYKTVLRDIESVMEQMNNVLRENNRRLFKVPLLEHLSMANRTISYVIELCVCALLEKGMHEEGLLRVGCAGSKLRRMKSAIDANVIAPPLPAEYQDVNVIACVLKLYLRELPDPLLTYNLYGEFVAAAQRSTEAQRKNAILNAINKLPEGHYYNLRYLTRFLHLLASKSDRNKMSTQNIAIVMSPNLLWAPNHGDADYAQKVSSTTSVNTIVEMLVADWEFFFEGDVDFYVTMSRDELFSVNVGFPLDRDASTATIGEPSLQGGGLMCKSVTTNGQSGVTYMQPSSLTNSSVGMTQSYMGASSSSGHATVSMNQNSHSGPSSALDSLRHSHSRSSSHDTSLILLSNESQGGGGNGSGGGSNAQMKHSQSNSSLSDHSSPPLMDSPKLPVRKNKHNKSAAPTPPSQSSSSSSHRQHQSKISQDNKDLVKTSLHDRLADSTASSGAGGKPEKPPRPVIAVAAATECQTLNRLAYKSAKSSGNSSSASSATTTGPGRPIALPRTTIVRGEGGLGSSREGLKSSEDEEDSPSSLVFLREDRHEKPAIPERPASLMRSNFFKGSLQEVNSSPMVEVGVGSSSSLSSNSVKKAQSFRATGETAQQRSKDSNNNNGGGGNGQTMLERAHIFNVDKQQVSFIDVGDGGPALRAAPIAQAESNAITTPTDVMGNSCGSVGGADLIMPPPSPRSFVAGGAAGATTTVDAKGVVIKRPQVPAPPPPTNHRPKSLDSIGGGGGGGGGGSDTEVTGL